MLGNLNGPTLVVILFIVLLLFGAPKLPGLAKSLGQSMRILKKEVSGGDGDAKTADPAAGADQAPRGDASASAPSNAPQNAPQQAAQPNQTDASGDGSAKS